MEPFSSRVNPSSVIPDSEASATAGFICLTHGPRPWNHICQSHSHMAQASLMTSGNESSKHVPDLGQPLWAHTRASATSEEAGVLGSLPLLSSLAPSPLSGCTSLKFRLQGAQMEPKASEHSNPSDVLWNSANGLCSSPGHYATSLGLPLTH